MVKIKNEDFDIQKIADSGQCFRLNQEGDGWINIAGDNILRISCDSKGSDDGTNSYLLDCSKKEFDTFWKAYFDLNDDYSKYRNAIPRKDKYLSSAADFGRGIRILRQDPWEMLITFIISQRKNIPAIKSSVEAICRNYGRQIGESFGKPIYSFPSVRALAGADEKVLRNCSLGYRVPYIISASQMIESGALDLAKIASLTDEELLSELMRVKGVGIKVANCVSLFAYHRIDAFPIDVWIARVLEEQYDNKFPYGLYEGFGGVIQQYMFYYARSTN